MTVVFAIAFIVMLVFSIYCFAWYNAFSYNGNRQMSRRIIEGIAKYVTIPVNGISATEYMEEANWQRP